MFFKLQKYFTILKKLFLTETEIQILTETQIPRDLTLRLTDVISSPLASHTCPMFRLNYQFPEPPDN